MKCCVCTETVRAEHSLVRIQLWVDEDGNRTISIEGCESMDDVDLASAELIYRKVRKLFRMPTTAEGYEWIQIFQDKARKATEALDKRRAGKAAKKRA